MAERPAASRLTRPLLCVVLALASTTALGGAQQYEPLSAAVQTRLQQSVADAAPSRSAFADPAEEQRWLAEMSPRLAKRIPDEATRNEFLLTAHYEAKRAGLDPHLVLGLIQVESNFRKYAVSKAGARGFMQVMPFWVRLIGSPEHNLFHLRTSLRYGCTILRHYLDIEKGDLMRALARYNGSLGRNSGYAEKVVGAWRRAWSPGDPPAGTVLRHTADDHAAGTPSRAAPRVKAAPPMRFMGSPN